MTAVSTSVVGHRCIFMGCLAGCDIPHVLWRQSPWTNQRLDDERVSLMKCSAFVLLQQWMISSERLWLVCSWFLCAISYQFNRFQIGTTLIDGLNRLSLHQCVKLLLSVSIDRQSGFHDAKSQMSTCWKWKNATAATTATEAPLKNYWQKRFASLCCADSVPGSTKWFNAIKEGEEEKNWLDCPSAENQSNLEG